jgi:hypothetical protein
MKKIPNKIQPQIITVEKFQTKSNPKFQKPFLSIKEKIVRANSEQFPTKIQPQISKPFLLTTKKTSRDPQMLVGGKYTYMHVLQLLLGC